MADPCAVVIGAPIHLEAMRERAAAHGEVLAFSDAETPKALDAITTRRPQVVALERLFAATSRGAALINRIKADPALAATEIRVVSHDGRYSRVSPRRTVAPPPAKMVAAAPAAEPAPPVDHRGERRAPRFRMADGTEVQVDGASAQLIDISAVGAQVIVQGTLKPNQRVRVTLADDAGVLRLDGAVAWALFEIPKGITRYRAGIEFRHAKADAVEAFAERHRSVEA